MGLAKAAFILFTISPLLPPRAVLGDFLSPLSPLLSPVINGLCDAVECGKGSCEVSLNHSFGFICKCNQGWSQLHVGDHFKFLPCIIPNCSLNYSCTEDSGASAPAPAPAPLPPPPNNASLFDPCMWTFCGGGNCSATSTYEHKCDCKEGFSNLFNLTTFPCYRDCSIGADCGNLGISLSNSTFSAASPPNVPSAGNSAADPFAGRKMLWLYMFTISLAMVLVI